MPSLDILRETKIIRTPRVIQLERIFDIPPSQKSKLYWHVDLPIEEREWNIGLIVGPSGCGKSTIAKEIFKDKVIENFEWDEEKAIIDNFPQDMSIKEIIELLSSIGFSSPPSWLRPYKILSNGEKFRVFIARALAEYKDLVVIDEFTSVVDRTVAQITSHTVQKIVRKRNQRFVAVTCHYDVIDWLQPDWIYEPPANSFIWSDGVRRRPPIELKIKKVHYSAWELFKHHHYLTGNLHKGAQCFVAFIKDEPVAFCAVLQMPISRKTAMWRISRVVVLPDYQGIGIGRTLTTFVASLFAAKGKVNIVTSHPGMIRSLNKSPSWKMTYKPFLNRIGHTHSNKSLRKSGSWNRLTASFLYIGKPNFKEARLFGII